MTMMVRHIAWVQSVSLPHALLLRWQGGLIKEVKATLWRRPGDWVMWLVQVAIEPSLLFENTYEPIPGYIPKDPTASQVPTEIRGAVSMTIFNAGQTTIQVGPPS